MRAEGRDGATRPGGGLLNETGGVRFDDPHAVLEADDAPATQAFRAAHREALDAYLRGTRLAVIRTAIAGEICRLDRAALPLSVGDGFIAHRVDQMTGESQIVAGATSDVLDRVLVDSATWSGVAPAIDWLVPSPKGTYAAFSVSERGDEDGAVRVVEIATGRLLDDRVDHVFLVPVAWLPDESGFYVNASPDHHARVSTPFLYLHRLGATRLPLPEPVWHLTGPYAFPQISTDDRHVVVSGSVYAPRPVAYREIGADDGWRPLLAGFAASFIGEADGDALIMLTTDRAPRGRIVSIPLATAADRDTWREIVPEGDGVMRSFARLGDGVVTAELVDGAWSVRVYDAGGQLDHVVALPSPTGLDLLFGFGQAPAEPRVFADGGGAVRLLRSSFDLPPAQVRYVPATRTLALLTPAAPGPRAIAATLRRCTSSDGTPVTYWEVGLRAEGGRRPALVYGYGAFSVVVNTPTYPAVVAPFLDAGGVLVLPHLRGGGEHGDTHWREARRHGRQRCYDDLYAVVEDAIAGGIVDPQRIAFAGASNGGLTAAVALTQRPDLWRAVVCAIPLIDVLVMMREPWAAPLVDELGDPRDAADAAVIAQYAPLQAIRPGTRYPAVLVDCGEHDLRCPPWHSRKLVAALEAATASDRPILYRERADGGHVLAEGREWAVWLAFLMRELEMVAR